MKGLGIDLCGVERIERELKRGDAFLHRFFTNSERAYIASRGQMGAQSAAAMFALDEIGVEHLPGGAPAYRLTGTAQARLGELGAEHAFLSLTHEAGMAAAVCVIE